MFRRRAGSVPVILPQIGGGVLADGNGVPITSAAGLNFRHLLFAASREVGGCGDETSAKASPVIC